MLAEAQRGPDDEQKDQVDESLMQDAARTKLTSYDDSTSVSLKAAYVHSKGIGGMIIWALGQDLVNGRPVLLETVGSVLRPTTAAAEERPAPVGFLLEQNYPNPFNPSTVIQFSLTAPGAVSLRVYNVIGQEVATLVNEARPAGTYRVSFNAGALASGVYFYRLSAAGGLVTRKMMLLK